VLTYQVAGSRLALLDGASKIASVDLVSETSSWKLERSQRAARLAEPLRSRSAFERTHRMVSELSPVGEAGAFQGYVGVDVSQISSQVEDDGVFLDAVHILSAIQAARHANFYVSGMEQLQGPRLSAARNVFSSLGKRANITFARPHETVITWLSFVREGSEAIHLNGKDESVVQLAGFASDEFPDLETGVAMAQIASTVLSKGLDENGAIPMEGDSRENLFKALAASPLPQVVAQFSESRVRPSGRELFDYLTTGKNASLYLLRPLLHYLDRLAESLKLIRDTVDIAA
jgi:hypothetical protein